MRNLLLTIALILNVFISFSQDNDNMGLGNPSNATDDISNTENYLMVKPQYCVSYSNTKHIPNWVSWHLSATDLGATKRKNNFRSDSSLPEGWYQVSMTDYSKTGFDRGHMCPSADRTASEEDNSATFLMTNMVPQAPNNNRITWEHLEDYCRKLIDQGNELYITCGPLGQGGNGSLGDAATISNDIVVPAQTWKIIVVLPEGDNDIKRITKTTRVIAVLIPNSQSCSEKE